MAADWLETLDAETREKAQRAIDVMRQGGADDPVIWVRSEINENIPQVARYFLLKNIAVETVGRAQEFLGWLPSEASPALQRILDAGVSMDDLGVIARYVIEQAIFRALVVLDNNADDTLDAETPGWMIVELDAEYESTGRELGGLHESIDGVIKSSL